MRVNSLKLVNYRNYQELELAFQPALNIFIGCNAQGKTNILEAVYYAACGSSFRGNSDGELIKWNADGGSISLGFSRLEVANQLDFAFRRDKRGRFHFHKISDSAIFAYFRSSESCIRTDVRARVHVRTYYMRPFDVCTVNHAILYIRRSDDGLCAYRALAFYSRERQNRRSAFYNGGIVDKRRGFVENFHSARKHFVKYFVFKPIIHQIERFCIINLKKSLRR